MMLLSSPLLLFLLASLASAFAFIALNVRFYTRRQMLLSLLVSALAGCLGGAAAEWLHSFIATQAETAPLFAGHGATLADGAISLLAALWFYLFSERFFSETIANAKSRHIVSAALVLVATFVGAAFSLLPLVVLLLLHIALSSIDLKKNAAQPKEPLFHDDKTYYTQRIKRNIRLEKKPNIYCLFLESYHSREALEELFDFDDSATDELLRKYGFTDYGSAFSNEPGTAASLSNLLTGQLYYASQTVSAFVLDALRENDYRIEFYDESAFVFAPYTAKGDYVVTQVPERILRLYTLIGPFLSQSVYTRAILARGFDPFETLVNFDAVYEALQQQFSSTDARPKMRCIRFGATHFAVGQPWQPDHSSFASPYLPLVEKTRHNLRQIVPFIVKKDPQAIVIILGDHGTMTHWNAWIGPGEPNDILRQRGVSVRQLALSLFGIRLAIRWPSSEYPRPDCMMPINIFRHIFSYLGANGEGAHYCTQLAPNISRTHDGICVVQDGKPLDEIAQFNTDVLVPGLLRRAEEGLATVDEFMHLGRTVVDRTLRIKILKKGNSLFPHAPILQAYLGEAMCIYGDERGLSYLKKYIDTFPKDKNVVSIYGIKLAQYAHYAEALRHLPFNKSNAWSRMELIAILSSLFSLGRKEDALAFCTDYLNAVKHNFKVDPPIGIALLEINCTDYAYETMATRDPSGSVRSAIYRTIASVALVQLGKYEEAEKLLLKLLPQRSSAWTFRLLSHVREKLGNVPGAMTALLEGIESRNDSHMLFLPLGLLLMRYSIHDPQFNRIKEIAQTQLEAFMTLCTRTHAFDIPWYKKAWLQGTHSTSPFQHYLSEGIYCGAHPAPWFNPFTYLLLHQDLWDVGIDPLMHFIVHGATELRQPSFSCSPAAFIKGKTELMKNSTLLIKTISAEWK